MELKIPVTNDGELTVYPELFILDYITTVDEQEELVTFSNGSKAIKYIITLRKPVSAATLKADLGKKFKNDTGGDPPFMSVGQVKNIYTPKGGHTQAIHLTGGGANTTPSAEAKKKRGRPAKKNTEAKPTKPKVKNPTDTSDVVEMRQAVGSELEEGTKMKRKRSLSVSSSSNPGSPSRSDRSRSPSPQTEHSRSPSPASGVEESDQDEPKEGASSTLYNNKGAPVNYDGEKNILK